MGEEGLCAARQSSSGNPAGSSARGSCLLFLFSLLRFLFLLLSFLLPPSLPPYSLIFSFFINYLILIKIFLFISASKLEGDIPFTWLALFEF